MYKTRLTTLIVLAAFTMILMESARSQSSTTLLDGFKNGPLKVCYSVAKGGAGTSFSFAVKCCQTTITRADQWSLSFPCKVQLASNAITEFVLKLKQDTKINRYAIMVDRDSTPFVKDLRLDAKESAEGLVYTADQATAEKDIVRKVKISRKDDPYQRLLITLGTYDRRKPTKSQMVEEFTFELKPNQS